MELPINPVAIPVAAVAALVVGALWYNPKIGFGNLWMRESGMTEEKMKSGKMGVIFGLSLAFAALLSLLLMQFTNHQWGAFGMIGGDPEARRRSTLFSNVYDLIMELISERLNTAHYTEESLVFLERYQ